jgi:hypothetical protein
MIEWFFSCDKLRVDKCVKSSLITPVLARGTLLAD